MNGQEKCGTSESLSLASETGCRSISDQSTASGSIRRSNRDRGKQEVTPHTSLVDHQTRRSVQRSFKDDTEDCESSLVDHQTRRSVQRSFKDDTEDCERSPSTDGRENDHSYHDRRNQSDSDDESVTGAQNPNNCNGKEGEGETNSEDISDSDGMDESDAAEYICGICEETFDTDGLLIRHMKSHPDDPDFEPPNLMEDSDSDSDKVNIKPVKKQQPLKKCQLCKNHFVNLSRHMRKIHIPLKCTKCDKIFKDRLKMKSHVLRVHSGKKYKCELCDKSYTTNYQLRVHKETKHGDNKARCMCEVCGEVFFHEVNLKRHKKMHQGENYKDFVCEVCGKRFAFHNKWRHIRTHTNTKAFKCPDCDKTFNEKDQLNKHVRIHTGEKPYKCERCPKAFNHNVSLKAHMRKFH